MRILGEKLSLNIAMTNLHGMLMTSTGKGGAHEVSSANS